MSERACICADPENCREPIPGRLCKRYFALPQPTGDSRPLADVLLVRPDPQAAEASMVNDRHGWHCPCVACRIDRGED